MWEVITKPCPVFKATLLTGVWLHSSVYVAVITYLDDDLAYFA